MAGRPAKRVLAKPAPSLPPSWRPAPPARRPVRQDARPARTTHPVEKEHRDKGEHRRKGKARWGRAGPGGGREEGRPGVMAAGGRAAEGRPDPRTAAAGGGLRGDAQERRRSGERQGPGVARLGEERSESGESADSGWRKRPERGATRKGCGCEKRRGEDRWGSADRERQLGEVTEERQKRQGERNNNPRKRRPRRTAASQTHQPFRNSSRAALTSSACVHSRPCGAPSTST